MPAPIVFFDIAGADADRQADFYREVFDWQVGPAGMLSVPVLGPNLAGAMRADPTDKIIYLGVEDVTATLASLVEHGGVVMAPRFEATGVAVLGLFRDPAGNLMGLVEMDGDKPKVP